LFARELGLDQFKELVSQTRGFLGEIPSQADATRAQMMEIMMAQDFQDLTGQVIKKTTEIIQSLESQLLQVLLDNLPTDRADAAKSLMNGPVVNADGRTDVVTNQSQVDDLLESLGF
jgi:chemotaxis protein CheZ